MRDIALHILDIAQNSVSAGATLVNIEVLEKAGNDRLILSVSDNGPGMDNEVLEGVPLSEPAVIRYMKEMIEENLAEITET